MAFLFIYFLMAANNRLALPWLTSTSVEQAKEKEKKKKYEPTLEIRPYQRKTKTKKMVENFLPSLSCSQISEPEQDDITETYHWTFI